MLKKETVDLLAESIQVVHVIRLKMRYKMIKGE